MTGGRQHLRVVGYAPPRPVRWRDGPRIHPWPGVMQRIGAAHAIGEELSLVMPTDRARIGRQCMPCTIGQDYARICRADRGGDRPDPVVPRNHSQDNGYYLYNGAGSAAAGQDPRRRRRWRVRRPSNQKSARPTPRGGAGGARTYMYRYLWAVRVQTRIR